MVHWLNNYNYKYERLIYASLNKSSMVLGFLLLKPNISMSGRNFLKILLIYVEKPGEK